MCRDSNSILSILTLYEGSLTSETDLAMLKEKVWPAVRASASRDGYWFQQDVDPPHTTVQCLEHYACL